MMDVDLPKIRNREELCSIPESDYILVTRRGCQNHRLHKSQCKHVLKKFFYIKTNSDGSIVKTFKPGEFPPRTSIYYHVVHNDKKTLNDYDGCKHCIK